MPLYNYPDVLADGYEYRQGTNRGYIERFDRQREARKSQSHIHRTDHRRQCIYIGDS